MKNYLIIILILSSLNLLAQKVNVDKDLSLGQSYLKNNQPTFAITHFTQSAAIGNPIAMNYLGRMYSVGSGVTKDEKRGFIWFRKAAEKGYKKAYYNLGFMYKYGLGTPQDFTLAFETFSKGASKNVPICYYAKGFMLYKGLGCAQDYSQAVVNFKLGARKSNRAAMYMLGLCYRNGYGTIINVDSAKFWLSKAETLHYKFAEDELSSVSPEYLPDREENQVALSSDTKKYEFGRGIPADIKNIAGQYDGIAVRYDWSGKKIIRVDNINVLIETKKGKIQCIWKEGDNISSVISGELIGNELKFDGSGYYKNDHYSKDNPAYFEFKSAGLIVSEIADSLALMGSLKLWSHTMREPEKPISVTLIRSRKITSELNSLTDSTDKILDPVFIDKKFIAFPNPFIGSLNVSFNVTQANSDCIISILNMSGVLVYQGNTEKLDIGKISRKITFNAPPGTYIIRLKINNEINSSVIIKQ